MPQACTLTRTCPGPGWGISRSTISKSPPALGTCTAFIFAKRHRLSSVRVLWMQAELPQGTKILSLRFFLFFVNSSLRVHGSGPICVFQSVNVKTCEIPDPLRMLPSRPNGRYDGKGSPPNSTVCASVSRFLFRQPQGSGRNVTRQGEFRMPQLPTPEEMNVYQ